MIPYLRGRNNGDGYNFTDSRRGEDKRSLFWGGKKRVRKTPGLVRARFEVSDVTAGNGLQKGKGKKKKIRVIDK